MASRPRNLLFMNKLLYRGNYCSYEPLIYRHSVKPLNAPIRVVAVVLYELDARCLQLTLSATFLKFTSPKLFHTLELSCLLCSPWLYVLTFTVEMKKAFNRSTGFPTFYLTDTLRTRTGKSST